MEQFIWQRGILFDILWCSILQWRMWLFSGYFKNRASLMYFCLSPNLQIRGEGWWLPIQGLIILTQERQRESYVSVGHTKIIKTYYRYVSNNDISKPVLTKLLFLIVASMNHLLHAYCRYIYLTVEISACFIFTIPVCE